MVKGDAVLLSERHLSAVAGELGEWIDQSLIDPAAWDGFTASLTRAFPGLAGGMVRQTSTQSGGVQSVSWMGITEDFQRLYTDYFVTRNPYMPMWLAAADGDVRVTNAVLPISTQAGSEFVEDWLEAQGNLRAATGMKVGGGSGSVAYLAAHYPSHHAPVYDKGLEALLNRLRPRMMRARRLSERLGTQIESVSHRHALLLREPDAAFIVGCDLRLCDVNAAASELLQEGSVARDRHGSLVLVDTALRNWLREEIDGCLAGYGAERDRVFQTAAGPLAVSVAQLPMAGGGGFFVETTMRLLVVVRVLRAGSRTDRAAAFATAYRLTKAEMDLSHLLGTGSTLREAADGLEITYETARHRLKAVFRKTDLHRQSDLVAVLSRLG